MRIPKFVALVALAAAASSCSSPQTTSNVQTADQDLTEAPREESPLPRPTTLREALVGSNTAVLVRVRSGNWPELESFVARLDDFDPKHPMSTAVRTVFEEGIVEALLPDALPVAHVWRALSDVDDDRDIWLRVDSTVSRREADLFRDGLFFPRPAVEMESFATVTLFVPTKDPMATRNEALAVKTGDHATIEVLDGHVVVRQSFPALAEPEPLVKEETKRTNALDAFFESDGIGALYVRPEQSMWIGLGFHESTALYDVAKRVADPFTFAYQVSTSSMARGATMPPHAMEAHDWVAVLRGGDSGELEVQGFGEYTPTGASGAAAAMQPKTARIPGIALPEGVETKLFVDAEGAVSPARFKEWVATLGLPETAYNSPRFYDRYIDEPLENPQFWAAPLQTALNGFAPLGLNETTTASWAIYGWRNQDGRQESVFAIYLSDVSPGELRQRSRELRHVQLLEVEGGTLLLAPKERRFPIGVEVLPWSEWSAAPTGSFSIDFNAERERRPGRDPHISKTFGTMRAEVALTENAFQFRGLLGANAETSAFAPIPVEASVTKRDETPCIGPLRQALLSISESLAINRQRRSSEKPPLLLGETLPAFETALAACRKSEPDQAQKWNYIEARMALTQAFYKLAKGQGPTEGPIPKACAEGIPGSCGNALGYWTGKACDGPEYTEVLVVAETMVEGREFSFDDTLPVCVPASAAEKAVGPADAEASLPAKARRQIERGRVVRVEDLETTTDR